MADRVQLQQLLMNLMLNSIDARKGIDGTRELTLISSQHDDNKEVLVAVSDNGVGLPPNASLIFSAFFAVKPHGIRVELGISPTIIESHGGAPLGRGKLRPRCYLLLDAA